MASAAPVQCREITIAFVRNGRQADAMSEIRTIPGQASHDPGRSTLPAIASLAACPARSTLGEAHREREPRGPAAGV
jgi:hypothetical protein